MTLLKKNVRFVNLMQFDIIKSMIPKLMELVRFTAVRIVVIVSQRQKIPLWRELRNPSA